MGEGSMVGDGTVGDAVVGVGASVADGATVAVGTSVGDGAGAVADGTTEVEVSASATRVGASRGCTAIEPHPARVTALKSKNTSSRARRLMFTSLKCNALGTKQMRRVGAVPWRQPGRVPLGVSQSRHFVGYRTSGLAWRRGVGASLLLHDPAAGF